MSETATLEATELVLTMSAPRRLAFSDVPVYLDALRYVVELSGAMAHPAETEMFTVFQGTDPVQEPVRFPEVVRIFRLQYGSPFQVVIDLGPLIEFLKQAGVVTFVALLVKMLDKAPERWMNLEEAMKLRRERKAASRTSRRARLDPGTGQAAVTPQRQDGETSSQLSADLLSSFVEPLVRAAIDSAQENGQRLDGDEVRAAAYRYIEYHEEETYEAGRVLKSRAVKIEFE